MGIRLRCPSQVTVTNTVTGRSHAVPFIAVTWNQTFRVVEVGLMRVWLS